MTLWMLWSIATAALVAAAATALDRAAFYVGLSRRFVWIGAIGMTVVAPMLLGLRRAPMASAPVVNLARVAPPVSVTPRAGPSISTVTTTGMRAVPGALETSPDSPSAQPRSISVEWRNAFGTWSIVAARAHVWVIRAWFAASSILLALFAGAIFRLGIARSRWRIAETEIGRVLLAPDTGPAVVGFLRPRVVLPSWVMSLDVRERALLLRHELEHLRAGDTRTLLVAELVVAVLPWNAAMWWMVRRLRLAIEMDCDTRVIRSVGSIYEYASMLLGVGEHYGARPCLG